MKILKKIRKILGSMPLAITLLVMLAAACALSSAVPQGQTFEWYSGQFGERMAAVITALHADDAYHSWWFLTLSGFLCLSLLMCNLIRIRPLIRRTRKEPGNFAGIWGAWVCHLGILLLIAGFALGQMTKEETFIYGVPGQTREVAGTGLTVTIDDFQVGLRADDTAEQYTSRITVSDRETGKQEQAEVTVNGPAVLFGRKFYQNSTGFAADAHVLKDGAEWQTETLCAGEGMSIRGKEDLQVILRAFYPDYVREKDGRPATASGEIRNPGYLYMAVYRGEVLGMNVLLPGDELTIDEYTVTFENPRNYTLISVKRDRFTLTALIGGIIVLAGLGMALYLRPEKIRAVREADGTWTVSGWCRKGGALWKERFDEAVRKQKGEEAGHG